MKIYTKIGDNGMTSLIDGTKVPKYDDRIEAVGSLDELNSFLGLLKDQNIDPYIKNFLTKIQIKIFIIESLLCSNTNENLHESDVEVLEKEIDKMNDDLTPIQNFILPGDHPIVSMCHVVRSICRRSERIVSKIAVIDVESGVKELRDRLNNMIDIWKPVKNKDVQEILSTVKFILTHQAETGERYTDFADPAQNVILKYLNRLSDFLFVLSRKLAKDLNAPETLWS